MLLRYDKQMAFEEGLAMFWKNSYTILIAFSGANQDGTGIKIDVLDT